MAGQTENTVMLEALNQQIQALNDLATAIAALTLSSTVNCTPQVTLSPNVMVSCTGAPTGSNFASANGLEGGTPPPGFVAPDPSTTNRKCKVSNQIWYTVHQILNQLIDMGVQNFASVGAVAMSTLVGAVLGSAEFPFGTLVGAVIGVVVGLVALLVTGGIDLSSTRSALENNEEALVCALYAAETATGAREAFVQVLVDLEAINSLEAQLLGLLLPNNLTNLLFFTSTADVETAIDETTIDITCSEACGSLPTGWTIVQGTGALTIGSNFELTSVVDDNGHYAISFQKGMGDCPSNDTVTVVADGRSTPHGFAISEYTEGCTGYTFVYNTNGSVPANHQECGSQVQGVDYENPFSMTFRIDTGC